MGETSSIQWTDATWNPWHGCVKVSPGCKYCYMYRDKEKYGQDPMKVVRSKGNFKDPLKWYEPKKIFTCSWSDWFIDQADGWRDEAWTIIKATPQHSYQILTKRPERVRAHLPTDWGEGYPNVWLGVSVESQDQVDRIDLLEDIPARVKFISFEPLIGPVTHGFRADVDWIILGGESGNDTGKYRYRPCEVKWMTDIMSAYGFTSSLFERDAKIFVKQLGTHLAKAMKLKDRHGGDINEFPEHLKIREFPA